MDSGEQLDRVFDITPEEVKPIKKPKKSQLTLSDKTEDLDKDYALSLIHI